MRQTYRHSRSSRASTLAEFAATLPFIVLTVVAGIAMIGVSFLYMYYKLKLTCATQMGTLVCMDTFQWQGAQRPGSPANQVSNVVLSSVQNYLTQMGIPSATISAPTVSLNPNDDGASFIIVKVTASNLPLLPAGGFIPASFSGISETTTFACGNPAPIGVAYIFGDDTPTNPSLSGAGGVLVPVYGGSMDPAMVPPENPGASVVYSFPQPPSSSMATGQFHELYSTLGGYRPM